MSLAATHLNTARLTLCSWGASSTPPRGWADARRTDGRMDRRTNGRNEGVIWCYIKLGNQRRTRGRMLFPWPLHGGRGGRGHLQLTDRRTCKKAERSEEGVQCATRYGRGEQTTFIYSQTTLQGCRRASPPNTPGEGDEMNLAKSPPDSLGEKYEWSTRLQRGHQKRNQSINKAVWKKIVCMFTQLLK